MKNNLDCEVIEDLLPSYVDQLTHEKTNILIAEHLQNCTSCRKKYENMSLKDDHSSLEEINYLKKIKRQNKKSFFKGMMSIIIVISLVLAYIGLISGWELSDAEIEGLGANYITDRDGTQSFSYEGKLTGDLTYKHYKINDHDIVLYGGYSLLSHQDDDGKDGSNFTITLPVKDELQYFYLYDEIIIVLGNEEEATAHKIYTLAQACLVNQYHPEEMLSYMTAFLQLQNNYSIEQHEYDGQKQIIVCFDEPNSQQIYDFIALTFFMFNENTGEIIFEETSGAGYSYRCEDYHEKTGNYGESYENYQKFYDQYFPS